MGRPGAGGRRRPDGAHLGDRPGQAPARRCGSSSTRPRSSRRTGSARSRSATRATRTRSRASPGAGSTTSPPSRPRPCSAATRTGAARSGCRSTTWRSARSSIYQRFFGDDFTVEYPTGSGAAAHLRRGRAGPRRPDRRDLAAGRRRPPPVYGGTERLQTDPAWKDNLLFFEYFHGDNGAGLGAMHQTGWTALVADLILDPPSDPGTPDGVSAPGMSR